MDIFAHSVWAAIAAKKYNDTNGKKISFGSTQDKPSRRKISIGWSAFWGVFPDLFAFGLPFLVLLFLVISGDLPLQPMWPGSAVVADHAPWIAGFIPFAYQISHSIVVFAGVFLLSWIIMQRLPIVLLGWALHIAIDIFSHAATFYPTPFLWPISDWKFLYGISWADPRYMIINYAAMLVCFWLVFLRKKSNSNE